MVVIKADTILVLYKTNASDEVFESAAFSSQVQLLLSMMSCVEGMFVRSVRFR